MPEQPTGAKKRPYTEARKESNVKWDKQNLDRISIALAKGSRDKIKAHAERQGESVNRFIIRAIEEAIERDQGRGASASETQTIEQGKHTV